MELSKIRNINVFYLSLEKTQYGELLYVGTIDEILKYVNESLIVSESDLPKFSYTNEKGELVTIYIESSLKQTDFRIEDIFESVENLGEVTDTGWYLVELIEKKLYLFILTNNNAVTHLPKNKIWRGSLPSLLGFCYNILRDV